MDRHCLQAARIILVNQALNSLPALRRPRPTRKSVHAKIAVLHRPRDTELHYAIETKTIKSCTLTGVYINCKYFFLTSVIHCQSCLPSPWKAARMNFFSIQGKMRLHCIAAKSSFHDSQGWKTKTVYLILNSCLITPSSYFN